MKPAAYVHSIDEVRALEQRAEKAEAEVERLREVICAREDLVCEKSREVERLRAALQEISDTRDATIKQSATAWLRNP